MPSRISLRAVKLLAAACAAAGIGGCADYLNNHDTVTLRAGDAQRWNKAVETTDPWPPYVKNSDINGDGQRTRLVERRYSTGNVIEPTDAGGTSSAGGGGAAPAQ